MYGISSSPRGARNIQKCDISRSICGISKTPSPSVARKNPTQMVLFKCICPKLDFFRFFYPKGSPAVGRCLFLGALMEPPVLRWSLSPWFKNCFFLSKIVTILVIRIKKKRLDALNTTQKNLALNKERFLKNLNKLPFLLKVQKWYFFLEFFLDFFRNGTLQCCHSCFRDYRVIKVSKITENIQKHWIQNRTNLRTKKAPWRNQKKMSV